MTQGMRGRSTDLFHDKLQALDLVNICPQRHYQGDGDHLLPILT